MGGRLTRRRPSSPSGEPTGGSLDVEPPVAADPGTEPELAGETVETATVPAATVATEELAASAEPDEDTAGEEGRRDADDAGAPPAGSLFDATPVADDANPYGEPGRPFSRSSAIYRGFWGAVGVLAAVALALAVREAVSVLELVLIAAFLAVGFNPIVELLIRHGVRRGWAVLAIALLVLGVVALVVYVVVGVLRDQIVTLIDDAPRLLADLKKHKSIARLDQKYHVISSLENKLKSPDFAEKTFGGVFNAGLSVFRGLADILIVFVLTLYFLAALPQLKRALFSLAPRSRRERVDQLGDEILRRVGRYVIGAALVALLAGTVSLLFLVTVGLSQYALPLAMLVALLDLVPLVGSITGAGIVTVVGFANSLPIGIACLVFYLIYETLEGYVIYPRVMRSSVDVPEYVTIVAVLVGGAVGGVVGALLALPLAAAILLLVREVWVRRQDAS